MSGTTAPVNTVTRQVGNGATVGPTSFGFYPAEGSRVASVQYNWSSASAYYEDLSTLKSLGIQTTIQSIWVDNSANQSAVTIVIAGCNQSIVVPSNSQGIFPAFFGDNAGVYISVSAHSGFSNISTTKICLLNIPANTAGIWSTNGATSSINSSGVAIQNLVGTQYYAATVTTTTPTIIIPPITGYRWFLSALYLTAEDNVAQTSGGYNSVAILDSAANIFVKLFYVPAASGVTNYAPIIQLSGLNLISQGIGNALKISLSTAVTAGGFQVTAIGGYTTQTP